MMLYICIKSRENISNGFRVIERTRNDDGRTDGQTDGQGDYYRASADFVWRGPNKDYFWPKAEKGEGWALPYICWAQDTTGL